MFNKMLSNYCLSFGNFSCPCISLIVHRRGVARSQMQVQSNKFWHVFLTSLGWFKVIQLRCALSPPESEITDLANQVADELSNSEDVSIKVLSDQIKQNLKILML